MPFITKYNFISITSKLFYTGDTFGDLYKRKITFFNKIEEDKLLKIKIILENVNSLPPKFYIKLPEAKDTKSLVFEGVNPAYHSTNSCPNLNAEYVNFYIPQQIKDANKIKEYREWFQLNRHLLERSDDLLNQRIKMAFGVEIQGKIQIPNSGFNNIDNLSLNELENSIDSLLDRLKNAYESASADEKKIVDLYSQNAYKYKKEHALWPKNTTSLAEDYIRECLQALDENFKSPMKMLLQQYYMVKYNPHLEFKGDLLSQLGFKRCSRCYKQG